MKELQLQLKKIYFILHFFDDQKMNGLFVRLKQSGIEGIETGEIEETKQSLAPLLKEWKTSLYVCDEGKMAAAIKNAGGYVIACCHEKNREETFSGIPFAAEGIEEIETDYFFKIFDRYIGRPWKIAKTKRCLVREMQESDLDSLYRLYQDKEVTRYTEGLYEDPEEEKVYITNYIQHIYRYYGFGTWLIFEKETGKLIGRAGFNYRPGFKDPELGFLIGVPYQRKGYAYEVCRKLIELGKEEFEFDAVSAFVEKENEASCHLCIKLGFFYKEDVVIDGKTYLHFYLEGQLEVTSG